MSLTDKQRRTAVEAYLGQFRPLAPAERKGQLAELRRLLKSTELKGVLSAFERARTLADWELLDTLGDPEELEKRVSKGFLNAARLRGAFLSGRLLDQSTLELNEGMRLDLVDGKLFPLKSLQLVDSGGKTDRFAHFPDLEELKVYVPYTAPRTAWKDLAPLASLPRLRKFELTGTHALADISALASLPAIESLTISNAGALVDLSPLAKLMRLERLELHDCKKVSDLSPLAKLSALKSIRLYDTAVADLRPLALKPSLEELELPYCRKLKGGLAPVTDRGGGRLRVLNLWASGITDLSAVAGMPLLEQLDARTEKPTTGLEKVKGLDALRDVRVLGKAGSLAFLAGAKELETLMLSDCNDVETLDALRGHDRLTRLNIKTAPALRDISGVSGLPALGGVSIENCEALSDVSSLGDLPALGKLLVEDCPVPRGHRVSRKAFNGDKYASTEDKGEIARLQSAYRAARTRAEEGPAPTVDGKETFPVQPTGERRLLGERDGTWIHLTPSIRRLRLTELRKALGSTARDVVSRALEEACNACDWEILESLAEGISASPNGEVLMAADAELIKRVKKAHHALLPPFATRLALATVRFGACTSLPDETLQVALNHGGFAAFPPALTRRYREATVNAARGASSTLRRGARKDAGAMRKLLAANASAEAVAQGLELLGQLDDFNTFDVLAEGLCISASGGIHVESPNGLGLEVPKKDSKPLGGHALEAVLRVLAGSGRLLGVHSLLLPETRPTELLAGLRSLAPRLRWVRLDGKSSGLREAKVKEARKGKFHRPPDKKPSLNAQEESLWEEHVMGVLVVSSDLALLAIRADSWKRDWEIRAVTPGTQQRLYSVFVSEVNVEGLRLQPDDRVLVQLSDYTCLVLDGATGRVVGRFSSTGWRDGFDARLTADEPTGVTWASWPSKPCSWEGKDGAA